jgi:hypothetical protein
MGIYFRRRFSLLKALHLNVTGRGVGLSLGVKGFHAGISASRRKYVSASIPGTGLYMRHYERRSPHSTAFHAAAVAPRNPLAIPHPVPSQPQPHGVSFALGYLFGIGLMIAPFALVVWWVLRHLG